jgi:hypothetical protein
MMVFFVDSSTNMNDERVFLAEQPVCVGGVGGTYSEETIERVK